MSFEISCPTDSSCPALCGASTSWFPRRRKDVDDRDKPGHDETETSSPGATLSRKSCRLMRSMGRRGSHRLRIRRFAEKALITFPFHNPSPGRAVTVADELGVETWRAPNVPLGPRRRM